MITEPPSAGWYPNPSGKPGQTPWDKVRCLWLGLSRRAQIMVAVAGLFAALAAGTVPIAVFNYVTGEEHSPSYQAGYTSGSSGAAHTAAIGLGTDFACRGSFAKAQLVDKSLEAKDYVQGCLDGLRDHPAGR
jgi:hypothetical protein